MQIPSHQGDRRTFGELLADLSKQMMTLVRKEIDLARMETTQKITDLGKDAVLISIGGALLYAGLLATLATAVIILAIWLSLWLSALIVSVSILATGAIVLLIGRSRLRRRDIRPSQTIISLKENKTWLKNRM